MKAFDRMRHLSVEIQKLTGVEFPGLAQWFSGDGDRRGTLTEGQFADLAVLTDDYLTCAERQIRAIESVLTVCDCQIVHAAGDFASCNPPLRPVSPSWLPVGANEVYVNEAPLAETHTLVFGADDGCGKWVAAARFERAVLSSKRRQCRCLFSGASIVASVIKMTRGVAI